jgi:hypothetical protein
MESELIQLGWRKSHANLYTHPTLGEIYRSERNGRWYHRLRGQADALLGRNLRDAIGKAKLIEGRLFA